MYIVRMGIKPAVGRGTVAVPHRGQNLAAAGTRWPQWDGGAEPLGPAVAAGDGHRLAGLGRQGLLQPRRADGGVPPLGGPGHHHAGRPTTRAAQHRPTPAITHTGPSPSRPASFGTRPRPLSRATLFVHRTSSPTARPCDRTAYHWQA